MKTFSEFISINSFIPVVGRFTIKSKDNITFDKSKLFEIQLNNCVLRTPNWTISNYVLCENIIEFCLSIAIKGGVQQLAESSFKGMQFDFTRAAEKTIGNCRVSFMVDK